MSEAESPENNGPENNRPETTASLPRATGRDIARYVLAHLGAMSHLKLQKLLYYIEAWHLAFFDQPLFKEDFQAWLHGPVLPSVWSAYKKDSILYTPLTPDNAPAMLPSELHAEQAEVIADVLSEYGDKTAYHLECLTHAEDPWVEARRGVPTGSPSANPICKETMRRFYQARLDG